MFSKGFTKAKKGKSTSCKNYTQIISNVQNPHLGRLRRSLDQLLSKSEVDRSHIEISGTRIDLNLRSGAGTLGVIADLLVKELFPVHGTGSERTHDIVTNSIVQRLCKKSRAQPSKNSHTRTVAGVSCHQAGRLLD